MAVVCVQSGGRGGNRLASAFADMLAGKPSVEEHSSIVAHNLEIPRFGNMANAAGDSLRALDEISALNFSQSAHAGAVCIPEG